MKRSYLCRFLRCTSLNVLGMLGLSCYILADTYFMAQWLAVEGLRIYFLGALPAGCNILLSVYFPCVARPGAGNWISLLRGVLLIVPLAFLMAQLWGSRGVWLTYLAAELLTAAASIFFLRRRCCR